MQTVEQGWTETTSADFIAYGRFFNPDRERQFEVIGDLAQAALAGAPAPLIVELCCGAGDLAALLLGRFKKARYLALDGSPAMLAEARRTNEAAGARLETRQFDLGSDDWRQMREQPRLVVSSLAVHHLDAAGKRKLFGDLRVLLEPGGAFVLADTMRPASPAGFASAAETYERVVAERSRKTFGDERMLDKLRELRWNYFRHPEDDTMDQPSTIAEQLGWLTEAGFRGVDVHWVLAGHAILAGSK